MHKFVYNLAEAVVTGLLLTAMYIAAGSEHLSNSAVKANDYNVNQGKD